jgi:hypothetical protein
VSTDRGDSWTQSNAIPFGFIAARSLVASGGSVLGAANGVFYSTDNAPAGTC